MSGVVGLSIAEILRTQSVIKALAADRATGAEGRIRQDN